MVSGPGRTPAAREAEARAVHAASVHAYLGALVTPALLAEHEAQPVGHHSPGLAQILGYLRQEPVENKLAVYAAAGGTTWQIVRLSGCQGVPHDFGDPARFASEDAALHEVFRRRLVAHGMAAAATIGAETIGAETIGAKRG